MKNDWFRRCSAPSLLLGFMFIKLGRYVLDVLCNMTRHYSLFFQLEIKMFCGGEDASWHSSRRIECSQAPA